MDFPNTFYKSAHMLFVTVNLEVDTSMDHHQMLEKTMLTVLFYVLGKVRTLNLIWFRFYKLAGDLSLIALFYPSDKDSRSSSNR